MSSSNTSDDHHYTVFIRLPFPRRDFVDPPLVDWNSEDDRKLWSTISQNSKSTELNWTELADQFDVPVPFLLQQAAWLYEHQMSTVRAQMQRIGTSRPTSMVGGPELSMISQAHKLSPSGKFNLDEASHSGSGSGSGNASTVKGSQAGSGRGSFRGSAATLAQTRSALNIIRPSQESLKMISKPNLLPIRTEQGSTEGSRTRTTDVPDTAGVTAERRVHPVISPPPSTSDTVSSSTQSSSSSEDEDDRGSEHQTRRRPLERSRLFRPARVLSPGESHSRDLSPVFLPFTSSHDSSLGQSTDETGQVRRNHDTTVETQRGDLRDTLRSPQRARTAAQPDSSETSHITNQESHNGSGLAIGKTNATKNVKDAGNTEPHLSPVADAATPSMGSSFSDLDNTSLTDSALEETLASHMRRGMASRVSTFSQSSKH